MSVEVKSSGSAVTTIKGRKNSIQKLDLYLKNVKKLGKLSELSRSKAEELFCSGIKEFEDIATFLARLCVPTVNSATPGADALQKAKMAIHTAEIYFGNIVAKLKTDFADTDYWRNAVHLESVMRLKRNIRVVVVRHCIVNNINLGIRAPSVKRDGLIAIIDAYLRVGGSDDLQVEGVNRAVVLCTSYLGVGRGGESSDVSWTKAKIECEPLATSGYNEYLPSYFDFEWPAKKVGEYQPMAMSCDAMSWQLCWVNAMSRFLILGGACHKRKDVHDNSLFPHTKHMAAAANCVTTYLQDALDSSTPFGQVEKYHPDTFNSIDPALTSTSIRRGTIRLMKRNPKIRQEERNYRSGHKHESRSEEYDEVEAIDTLPGMKVLTGYEDIYATHVLPCLRKVIATTNIVHLKNFSLALFGRGLPAGFHDNPQLHQGLLVFLASTLMYYKKWKEELKIDVGDGEVKHHILVRTVQSVAKQHNINEGLRLVWGDAIEKDWVECNEKAVEAPVNVVQLGEIVADLQRDMRRVKADVASIKDVVTTILSHVQTTSTVQESLPIATAAVSPPPVPPRPPAAVVLTQDQELYVMPRDCTLRHFIVDYYRYGLQCLFKWNTEAEIYDKRKKSQAMQLCEVALHHATDGERATLRKSIPPVECASYAAWLLDVDAAASSIAMKYMAALGREEAATSHTQPRKRKRATIKYTTSALWARHTKAKKLREKAEVAAESLESDDSDSDNDL